MGKRADEVEYGSVEAGDGGLRKGVLIDGTDGAPNPAVRRFTLAPGASVPKHTKEVEREQYVLTGRACFSVPSPTATTRSNLSDRPIPARYPRNPS